jgi:hypothetical protein
MSFKTLENRFTENVNKLYAGATYKFENGKPSTGRNDDPLIVRKPGDGYWNFAESRSTPISSTLVDVKRLTLFSLSKRGILFLAKQQLLQTGNTFEHTRIINPAFVLANAVPFVHVKRNLRPLPVGKTINKILSSVGLKKPEGNNSIDELRKIGQLQQETYNKFVSGTTVTSLLKKIPVIGKTVSAATTKRSMGEVDAAGPGKNEQEHWKYRRPELGKNNSGYIMFSKITEENAKRREYSVEATLSKFSEANEDPRGFAEKMMNWTGPSMSYPMRQEAVDKAKKELSNFKSSYKSPMLVFYGPLKNNGKYTTYLKRTDGKEEWSGKLLTTDYERYVNNKFNTSNESQTTRQSDLLSDGAIERGLMKINNSYKNSQTSTLQNELDKKIKKYIENQDSDIKTGNTITYIKYFNPKDSLRSLNVDAIIEGKDSNPQTLADGIRERTKTKKISYIRDASNDIRKEKSPGVAQEAYSRIATNFKDPVVVSFAMGPDNRTTQGQGHIRFRAFIKDLIETTTPNYTPLQYIGRMERFNYYTGVERKISFRLGLLSFSEDELDGMWRRLNFLTGMAYPYGFNRGIFQPNNIRLTIGNVYVNQPGYIQSINTDFAGITETWEITPGKQVPISAMVTMDFVLIEKASRLADSPFYGINEGKAGFSTQIPTATQQNDSRNSAPTVADPVLSSTTVPVNSVRPPANPSNAANILNTVRNEVGFSSNALVTNSSLANPFARNP